MAKNAHQKATAKKNATVTVANNEKDLNAQQPEHEVDANGGDNSNNGSSQQDQRFDNLWFGAGSHGKTRVLAQGRNVYIEGISDPIGEPGNERVEVMQLCGPGKGHRAFVASSEIRGLSNKSGTACVLAEPELTELQLVRRLADKLWYEMNGNGNNAGQQPQQEETKAKSNGTEATLVLPNGDHVRVFVRDNPNQPLALVWTRMSDRPQSDQMKLVLKPAKLKKDEPWGNEESDKVLSTRGFIAVIESLPVETITPAAK